MFPSVGVDSIELIPEACGRVAQLGVVSRLELQGAALFALFVRKGCVFGPGLEYYRHADWLGSSRLTSTPSRTVSGDVAYAPFGETYASSGSPDLSFAGQNPNANPYDFIYREYGIQGRWPSPDPLDAGAFNLADPQSLDRYAYVRNNPTGLVDPLGLVNIPGYRSLVDDYAGLGGGVQFGATWNEFELLNIALGNTDYPGCPYGDCSASQLAQIASTVMGVLDWTMLSNLPLTYAPTASPQTPAISAKGQVCENKVQNAVNSTLNTSTQFLGPELDNNSDASQPGLINGAYNFNYFAPGVNIQAPGVLPSCGRFDSGLHIVVPGVCNPSGDPFIQPWGYDAQLNGSFFTARIDSADPYADVVSFFIHLVEDVIFKSQHGC